MSHFAEQSPVSLHIPDIARHESKRHHALSSAPFFSLSRNRCAVVVTDAVTSNGELRRRSEGEKKEARFPIQRRWLSATLSTFGEIITRFAERRRLSRKKLPISNLDGRPAWSQHSCIYPARFFFLLFPVPPFAQKNGPLHWYERWLVATHNFSFFHFFFLIQLFQTRNNARQRGRI